MNRLTLCLIAGLFFFWEAGFGFGQSEGLTFKLKLHERGIQLLKSQTKLDSGLLDSAIESAIHVDANHLLKPIEKQFKVSKRDMYFHCLDHPLAFENLVPLLASLEQECDSEQFPSLPFLAYQIGLRKQSLARLVSIAETNLRRFHDDEANHSNLVLDEIRFAYSLGDLHRKDSSASLETVADDVEPHHFKDVLKSEWLLKNEKEMKLERLDRAIGETKFEMCREVLLTHYLPIVDDKSLRTESGRRLVRELIQLFLRFEQKEDREIRRLLWKYNSDPGLESVGLKLLQLSRVTRSELVKLVRRSQTFSSDKQLIDFVVESSTKKAVQKKGFRKKWIESLMAHDLSVDQLEKAQAIAGTFKLALPKWALQEFAIRNSRLDLIDPLLSENERELLVLRHSQLFAEDEFQKVVEKRRSQFHAELDSLPQGKKLSWLTEYVWVKAKSSNKEGNDALILEKEIWEAFEDLKRTPGAGRIIAGTYDIFLGTGECNRKILDNMMRSLPIAQQEVTKYNVKNLVRKISQTKNVQRQRDVLATALELIEFSKGRNINTVDIASELAFAFAKIGHKQGVNEILKGMKDGERKAWVCFECAKVFPPNQYNYGRVGFSPYLPGGVF